MGRKDLIEFDGVLEAALGGGQYSIKIKDGSETIRARINGRMRRNNIRVIPGDRVLVAVSPSDLSHGMIIRRF